MNQFNEKYSDLSKALAKDTEDDDISHWTVQEKAFKMWESIRPFKTSWSYVRVVLKNPVDLSAEIFSEENQSQFIWWLKIVYVVSAVVAFGSVFGICFIRRHKSGFLKAALVFVLIIASFIALVNGLIISIALPYIAWGCEGSNYALSSDANFVGSDLWM